MDLFGFLPENKQTCIFRQIICFLSALNVLNIKTWIICALLHKCILFIVSDLIGSDYLRSFLILFLSIIAEENNISLNKSLETLKTSSIDTHLKKMPRGFTLN